MLHIANPFLLGFISGIIGGMAIWYAYEQYGVFMAFATCLVLVVIIISEVE